METNLTNDATKRSKKAKNELSREVEQDVTDLPNPTIMPLSEKMQLHASDTKQFNLGLTGKLPAFETIQNVIASTIPKCYKQMRSDSRATYSSLIKAKWIQTNSKYTNHLKYTICEINDKIWCAGHNVITVYNKQCDKIKTMRAHDSIDIRSMAWSNGRVFAVSGNEDESKYLSGLITFNQYGEDVTYKMHGKFSNICAQGGYLYALESEEHQVIFGKYEGQWKILRKIQLDYQSHKREKHGFLLHDWYMDRLCVNSGTIYVSSWNYIYTFNTEGKPLQRLESKKTNEIALCGVDEDGIMLVSELNGGNLYVVCNNTWHVLTLKGQLFRYQQHLMDTDGNLWVVTRSSISKHIHVSILKHIQVADFQDSSRTIGKFQISESVDLSENSTQSDFPPSSYTTQVKYKAGQKPKNFLDLYSSHMVDNVDDLYSSHMVDNVDKLLLTKQSNSTKLESNEKIKHTKLVTKTVFSSLHKKNWLKIAKKDTHIESFKMCEINDEIWCAGKNRIKVFSKKCDEIKTMTHDSLDIRSIAWVNHSLRVFVISMKEDETMSSSGLFSFDIDGHDVMYEMDGNFSDICAQGSYLYVLESDEHKVIVCKYEDECNIVRQIQLAFQSHRSEKHLLHNLYKDRLCVNQNTIYVSSQNYIHCYNTEGKLQWRLESKEHHDIALCGVDEEGTMLVAEINKDNIYVVCNNTWHVLSLSGGNQELLLDSDGNFWVVSKYSIFKYVQLADFQTKYEMLSQNESKRITKSEAEISDRTEQARQKVRSRPVDSSEYRSDEHLSELALSSSHKKSDKYGNKSRKDSKMTKPLYTSSSCMPEQDEVLPKQINLNDYKSSKQTMQRKSVTKPVFSSLHEEFKWVQIARKHTKVNSFKMCEINEEIWCAGTNMIEVFSKKCEKIKTMTHDSLDIRSIVWVNERVFVISGNEYESMAPLGLFSFDKDGHDVKYDLHGKFSGICAQEGYLYALEYEKYKIFVGKYKNQWNPVREIQLKHDIGYIRDLCVRKNAIFAISRNCICTYTYEGKLQQSLKSKLHLSRIALCDVDEEGTMLVSELNGDKLYVVSNNTWHILTLGGNPSQLLQFLVDKDGYLWVLSKTTILKYAHRNKADCFAAFQTKYKMLYQNESNQLKDQRKPVTKPIFSTLCEKWVETASKYMGFQSYKMCEINDEIWCAGQDMIKVYNKECKNIIIMKHDILHIRSIAWSNDRVFIVNYNEESHKVITVKPGLYSFNKDGNDVTYETNGKFSDICAHRGYLYALDSQKYKVVIGEYEKKWNTVKEIQLKDNYGIPMDRLCVNHNSICVGSQGKVIHIYNTDGELWKVVTKKYHFWLTNLCDVDEESSCLVADEVNDKLYVVTEQTRQALTLKGKTLNYPVHALVDTDENLWVAELNKPYRLLKYVPELRRRCVVM